MNAKIENSSLYGSVVLCMEGEANCTVNRKRYNLKPKQALIIIPGSVFSIEEESGKADSVAQINLEERNYRSIVIDRQAWDIMIHVRDNPLITLTDLEIRELTALEEMSNLIKEDTLPRPYASYQRRLMMDVMLYEVLNLVARRIDYAGRSPANNSSKRMFLSFVDILEKGKGRIRSVSEVAEHLCVSPKYIAKTVKDVSGMTPSAWIHDFTVREAVRMLRYTDEPVKVISEELGFPNASFFGTWFRKYVGVSPSAYRDRDKAMDEMGIPDGS